MADIEIKCQVPNVLYISSCPFLRSTMWNIGLCVAGMLVFLQYEECHWLVVTGAVCLIVLGLSELGESEDVIADLGSGHLVMCRRSWLERLITHTCQTSVTPLTQVSAVCLMRCGRGWGGARLTPCVRLRSGEAVPLFRRSFPPSQRTELRTLVNQLTTFLGLGGLQSVSSWAVDLDLDPADPDLDPVTSLESQSKELLLLLRDKMRSEE